jgi:hypothetical protein
MVLAEEDAGWAGVKYAAHAGCALCAGRTVPRLRNAWDAPPYAMPAADRLIGRRDVQQFQTRLHGVLLMPPKPKDCNYCDKSTIFFGLTLLLCISVCITPSKLVFLSSFHIHISRHISFVYKIYTYRHAWPLFLWQRINTEPALCELVKKKKTRPATGEGRGGVTAPGILVRDEAFSDRSRENPRESLSHILIQWCHT